MAGRGASPDDHDSRRPRTLRGKGGTVKKALSLPLLLIGFALVALGGVAVRDSLDGKQELSAQLAARGTMTPADASIPNALVDDAATAGSYADWIDATMTAATGDRAFNEIGRFVAAAGTGDTDDPSKALLGPDGSPVVNPLRQIAFEASTGTTSLGAAILAFKVADLAITVGAVMAVLGLALLGSGLVLADLHLLALARKHVHLPHLHPHHA